MPRSLKPTEDNFLLKGGPPEKDVGSKSSLASPDDSGVLNAPSFIFKGSPDVSLIQRPPPTMESSFWPSLATPSVALSQDSTPSEPPEIDILSLCRNSSAGTSRLSGFASAASSVSKPLRGSEMFSCVRCKGDNPQPIQVIYSPCGHKCCCISCSKSARHCDACGEEIQKRQKLP